jgi:hypothetical protein
MATKVLVGSMDKYGCIDAANNLALVLVESSRPKRQRIKI